LKGRVVLLDFWATWCAPCRKSMPDLQALHDKYSARGLTVIGISIDEGGPAKVQRYVRSKKFTYPIVMDDAKDPAWDAYKVKAIPAAFLLDRDGRVVAQWTGAPPDARALEAQLAKLLTVD
jgi:thiol-disulfide isomerase/thioredoxin